MADLVLRPAPHSCVQNPTPPIRSTTPSRQVVLAAMIRICRGGH
jgi:hypothetical protein